MSLTIDLGAAAPHVSDAEFAAWASSQTVFLSSVMGELAPERRAVADRLQRAGFRVRWFEELGGRDDGAQHAYLTEVRAATIYVGVLGDVYGAFLADGPYAGFSPTHAEYLEARAAGKRVSFWAREPGDAREGHARKFLDEVRTFHVTGSFSHADDLIAGLSRRLRELAVEDLSPWVKLGDTVVRAARVTAGAKEVTIEARVYDRAALRALQAAAGHGDSWSRGEELAVTFFDESGRGRIEELSVAATSSAFADVTLKASFERAATDSMRVSMAGSSPDDIVERSLRAALFGEPIPEGLRMFGMGNTDDPWAELAGVRLSEDSVRSLARLLLVERLVGTGNASAIEHFELGPRRDGKRRVEMSYWEPKVYANHAPQLRPVAGERTWA
jgi:hypothetical protein